MAISLDGTLQNTAMLQLGRTHRHEQSLCNTINGEWSEVAIINAPDGEQFVGGSWLFLETLL